MARERYTNRYTCPTCGHTGTVEWSEDQMNFRSDLNVEGVPSEGFYILQVGANSDTKEPWCSVCKIKAAKG